MTTDPRRVLQEAAEHRAPCEVLPRSGGVVRGVVVRVERGGVVLRLDDGARVAAGEDVRVWLAAAGAVHTFEASVVRVGVPVPDRSQAGVMLGFIDRWREAAPESASADRDIALLPPSGAPVSLLRPPARLIHLSVDGASFTLPDDFKLVFVEKGTFRVHLSAPGAGTVTAGARVRALAPAEGHVLYDLAFEDVDDPERHREIVARLAP